MDDVSFLRFSDPEGNRIDLTEAVFPICKLGDNGLEFLGTGFFISGAGVFVTASHVLEGETSNLYAITFLPNNECLQRPIEQFTSGNGCDVGVGTIRQATDNSGNLLRTKQLPLSVYEPEQGELLSCAGYPHSTITNYADSGSSTANFTLNTVHGEVTSVTTEGFGVVRGHVYVVDLTNGGGSSGGPVFTPAAKGVIGVSSSGNDGGYYYVVSAISQIRNLALNNIQLPNETPRTVIVQELIDLNFVTVL